MFGMGPLELLLVGAGAFVFLVVVYIIIYSSLYRRVGPNEVLIISGGSGEVVQDDRGERKRLGFRVVKGGGTLVNPLKERVEVMSLELVTLDIQTPEFYTRLGVPIKVDGVAQIKVKGDDVSIRTAAEQFLSKSLDEIKQIAYQMMAGHLRAILGTLTVEEIYAGHEAFAQKVAEVTAQDLSNMGLTVVSFTIREISDSRGYLEALGKPRIAQVKRDATIGEAEATRDATIKSAEANQLAQMAKLAADTQIAEAQRDYNIKVQDFDASVNQKKAEADLAYDLQRYKTAQLVKEQEVMVEYVEKEKQTQVQEQEILRKEKELAATVQKPAEAERQRIQTIAEAEQFRLQTTAQGQAAAMKTTGFAQAEVVKATGTAEAEANKVRGLAAAEVTQATAMAEAKAIEAKGLAQAEAIKAQGLAEALAMAKRAEAFRSYNEAAVAQMFIEKLPEMAQAVASPLSKIDHIVLINSGGGGDGVGASRLTGEVTQIVSQVPPILEAMTGIKLTDLLQRIPGLGQATPGDGMPAEEVSPKSGSKPTPESAKQGST